VRSHARVGIGATHVSAVLQDVSASVSMRGGREYRGEQGNPLAPDETVRALAHEPFAITPLAVNGWCTASRTGSNVYTTQPIIR
jgi:hypothetical protein